MATVFSCKKPEPSFPLLAYVYQRITSYALSIIRLVDLWPYLGLALVNSEPASRAPIHLLIGADLYGALLMNNLRQDPLGTPTAQLTKFG